MLDGLLRRVGFHVKWMPATDGHARAGVSVEFEPRPWEPPAEAELVTYKAAYLAHREAADQGKILTQDRWLGRVVRHHADPERGLLLFLERTDYALFAATNLNLRRTLESGQPHEFARWVSEAVGTPADETTERSARYLANPLNVIAAVVTRDGFLVVPRRGHHVGEGAGLLQASVGGFWEKSDIDHGVKHTLVREADEELGIKLEPDSIRYVCFGFNGRTGEPDVLVTAVAAEDERGLRAAYAERRAHSAHPEVLLPEGDNDAAGLWDLNAPGELERRVKHLRDAAAWCQPSDRAAVLAALVERFGAERVDRLLPY